ncbi:MAG: hypothetical protein ACR2H4_16675 [Pyrinomonadaceae bacterium]
MAKTFWLILTVAALLWYSIIMVYVAIKGAGDIRQMLKSLSATFGENDGK